MMELMEALATIDIKPEAPSPRHPDLSLVTRLKRPNPMTSHPPGDHQDGGGGVGRLSGQELSHAGRRTGRVQLQVPHLVSVATRAAGAGRQLRQVHGTGRSDGVTRGLVTRRGEFSHLSLTEKYLCM